MNFYDTLQNATQKERDGFLSIPLIGAATNSGVSRQLYVAFLAQAYHHVKHTFPLLALAASRTEDEIYQDALCEYMEEERGHEKWILDDIAAMGGDAAAVRQGEPGPACKVMVGYTYYAVEHVSPYAMLGSVHVLEGMSTLLADRAAASIATSLQRCDDQGFSYLKSHGALDIEHVAFFKKLVGTIKDAGKQKVIIDTSRIIYGLYGNIFRELGAGSIGIRHAA